MYLSAFCRILDGMHSGTTWRLGHRPALDGLRGMAIGLVVICHATVGRFANGGSVGVTVFFALSGFLITSLLVEESATTGKVSMRRFYARRARRLLPALAVYLTAWSGLAVAGWHEFVITPAEVVAAALYFMNWVMAFSGASDPTAITWSLSIEEQFYLFWPLLLLAARGRRYGPEVAAGFGVVFAVAMRVHLWSVPGSARLIYYRTDTHMDSLLLGCLLALAVHRFGTSRLRGGLGWVGVAAILVLLVDQSDWLRYVAEPLIAAAGACALIASILVGGSRWLEATPLRWLGRRSYALYLWHYPLTMLANDRHDVIPMWLAVALSFAAAEASWWLVERPFRRRRSRDAEEVEVRVDRVAA